MKRIFEYKVIRNFLLGIVLSFLFSSLAEAKLVENDYLRVQFSGNGGVTSWYTKKYKEDFFDYDFKFPEKMDDKSSWKKSGIDFCLFPGSDLREGSVEEEVESRVKVHSENIVILTRESRAEGRECSILPNGLELSQKWEFSSKYSAHLTIGLKNRTSNPVDLKRKDSCMGLFVFPIFKDSIYRSEFVAQNSNGEVEDLSPTLGKLKTIGDDYEWIGARNQYYAIGIDEKTAVGEYLHGKYETKLKENDRVVEKELTAVGWRFAWPSLRPKEELKASFEIYLGPKKESELKDTSFNKLFNTWDGYTGPIGKVMFSLLKHLHDITGNYGLAILLLTLLVKVILHPLNKKQMHAMKKMQQLQPKIQELKEKYGKDQNKLNSELQKLFAEHQVNPLGGCFPILIQIPIFIGLFTCLSSAIELKNVPFAWMDDLSQPDPLCILPILFCVGIYYSSKANSTGDPSQAMIMKGMPIIMFFVFLNMSAGVMLYITGQSLFSMVEQRINKMSVDENEDENRTKEDNSDKVKKKSKRKS